MLKLLLREDRYALRKEYFLRVIVIILSLLTCVLIIWSIVLLAPYFQISVEKEIVGKQLEEIKDSNVTKDRIQLEAISEVVAEKIEVLDEAGVAPSYILRYVIEDPVEGIGLNTIGINLIKSDSGEVKAHVELTGVAGVRTNLVDLQKVLVNKEVFDAVNIPYSNFTVDKDIPFTINVESVELISFLNDA